MGSYNSIFIFPDFSTTDFDVMNPYDVNDFSYELNWANQPEEKSVLLRKSEDNRNATPKSLLEQRKTHSKQSGADNKNLKTKQQQHWLMMILSYLWKTIFKSTDRKQKQLCEHKANVFNDKRQDEVTQSSPAFERNYKSSLILQAAITYLTTDQVDKDKSQDNDKRINKSDHELKCQCKELEAENVKLKSQLETLNIGQRNTEIEEELDELRQTNARNKSEIDKFENENKNLNSKVKELEMSVLHRNKELEHKTKVITDLESMKENLTQEIALFKSKQVVNVQILFNQRTAWADSVEDTLMSILKSKIDSNALELRFTQCAASEEVKPEYPVLVVCLVVSRIGTDVDKGMQGLKTTGNTVLLVVHHKDVHALPNQSSDRILQSPEHKRCGGIYDMGYQGNKGFYECGMNVTTIINLINFIKEHGVKEPMFSDK